MKRRRTTLGGAARLLVTGGFALVGCTVLLDPPSGVAAGPCARDTDCALQQVCVVSVCRETCATDGACTPDEACLEGACLPRADGDAGSDASLQDATPCADVTSDPNNCGACGHICEGDHQVWACAASHCVPSGCASGWGDCNGDSRDGCEVDLSNDATNCRYCGGQCDDLPWNLCREANCLRVSDYPSSNQNWDQDRFTGGSLWIAVKIHIDLGGTLTGLGFQTVTNGDTQGGNTQTDEADAGEGGDGSPSGAIGQWALFTDDDGPRAPVAATVTNYVVVEGKNEIAVKTPPAVMSGTYWVVGSWNAVLVDFRAGPDPQIPEGGVLPPNWVYGNGTGDLDAPGASFPSNGTLRVDRQPWVYAIVAH